MHSTLVRPCRSRLQASGVPMEPLRLMDSWAVPLRPSAAYVLDGRRYQRNRRLHPVLAIGSPRQTGGHPANGLETFPYRWRLPRASVSFPWAAAHIAQGVVGLSLTLGSG